MRVVALKFKDESGIYDSPIHYYYTTIYVTAGDEVIVNTPDRGMQVAMVSDTKVTAGQVVEDYIVQRVDKSEYTRIKECEVKIQELKEELIDIMKSTEIEELPSILGKYAMSARDIMDNKQ